MSNPNDCESPAFPTIAEAGAALRANATTVRALTEEAIRKIEERESAVQAWVSVDGEGALKRADELDAELARGIDHGPLHGIPIGIKDIIDIAGQPTGCNFAPFAERVATQDATVVARLRQAGAILLGKTVTTQFAGFDPPRTRNPRNLDHTPGGSSSGSAAAVAAGMCPAAIGSQTGGSITRPASFCGIAGCKPSFGSVPTAGVFPIAKSLDHPGPLATTVGDLAILLDALTEGRQSLAAIGPAENPPRIGRLRELFETAVDAVMLDAFGQAVDQLDAAGAEVADVTLPRLFESVIANHRTVMLYEQGQVHAELLAKYREHYGPGFAGMTDEGLAISESEYRKSKEHQEQLRREMEPLFEDFDILACPAAVGPAPGPETTGDPSMNAPWSYTGLPTITFPMDRTDAGLPLGIQLIGPMHGEPQLFAAALWCEARLQETDA